MQPRHIDKIQDAPVKALACMPLNPHLATHQAYAVGRLTLSMLLISSASLIGGCGSTSQAHLVASPSPPTDVSCTSDTRAKNATLATTAAQTTSTVLHNSQAQMRLDAALDRARRTQRLFPDLTPINIADYKGLVEEAARLAHIARARELIQTAASKHSTAPSAPSADPTEDELLTYLPWAGTVETIPERATDITQRAATLINRATDNVKGIQQLLHSDTPSEARSEAPLSPQDGVSPIPIATFSVREQKGIFSDLTTLAAFRAFHLLALLSAAHLHTMLTSNPPATDREINSEVWMFNTSRYLSAYFDAYFRGGQFVQVTIDQKDFVSTLATRIKAQLPKNAGGQGITADQINTILKPEFDKLCGESGASTTACMGSSLGKTAFVTRAGLTVQFSGVSLTLGGKDKLGLSHTYPQVSEFGPQLIRVFVEALFDANGQHPPGVPNATACDSDNRLFTQSECVKPTDALDARREQIDMLSASAEAISSTATGAIIRGGGIASLNNEAVAAMLETLAGVNARKISEKVLYINSSGGACPLTPIALRVEDHG